jgi:DNA-binding transcriptional ArsR family regulator
VISGGYTMVPNAVLRGEVTTLDGRPIRPLARLLYALVLDRSNCGTRLCTASQAYFAEKLGISERHVRTLVKELGEAGILDVRREGRTITLDQPELPINDEENPDGSQ